MIEGVAQAVGDEIDERRQVGVDVGGVDGLVVLQAALHRQHDGRVAGLEQFEVEQQAGGAPVVDRLEVLAQQLAADRDPSSTTLVSSSVSVLPSIALEW